MKFNINEYLSKYYQYAFKISDYLQAPQCSGIYFIVSDLQDDQLLWYIGSSKCLRSRLYKHPVFKKINKKYDMGDLTFFILPLSEDQYKKAEIFYIQQLKPDYNKHYSNGWPVKSEAVK